MKEGGRDTLNDRLWEFDGQTCAVAEVPQWEAFLAAAYPSRRERARRVRWLGWIAWHMRGCTHLAWWDIPAWSGRQKLVLAPALAGLVTLMACFGLWIVLFGEQTSQVLWWLFVIVTAFVIARVGPGRLRRSSWPLVLVPSRPQSRRELAALVEALVTGVPLRLVLIRLWTRPVPDTVTPGGSYRACRRSTAVDVIACLLTGLPAALLALAFGPRLLAVGGVLTGFAFATALADGKLPAVKLAELRLLLGGRRVSFHRLLERAVGRGLLLQSGPYYRFREHGLQDYLAACHRAAVRARARRIPDAVAAATSGVRPRLLALLSRQAIIRVAGVIGVGTGAAAFAGLLAHDRSAGGSAWGSVLALVLESVTLGAFAALGSFLLLNGLVRGIRWSLWASSRMSQRVRAIVLGVVVVVAVVIVWLAGPGAISHGIAIFVVTVGPAAVVAGVGGWACALVHLRWQAARHVPLRHVADVLLAAVTGVTVLLLVDRTLLGVQAAAGLMFPVAVWLSVVAWRAMKDADRVAVRAGADIAASLLLGASLVLVLVWLASMLSMPPSEVAVLRGVVGYTAAVIDLPWWSWLGLYLVLAGTSLAFAVWAGGLTRVTGWFTRLRVVPSVNATRRVLTGVHIGLMVTMLVGLAAPTAAGVALRGRIAARYTETLADDLRARGELAAYTEIRRQFATAPASAAQVAPLAAIVARIHYISGPADKEQGATSTELDLARRIGLLQALIIEYGPEPHLTQAVDAAIRQAGLDSPVPDAEKLDARLGMLDAAQQQEDTTAKHADQAGDLAATAISYLLYIPRIGHTEVVQIIREYLGSLVEQSPLRDLFATWAGRLANRSAPPRAADMVVPDSGRLKDAAAAEVTREIAQTEVTDPSAARDLLNENGITAAVDLINQARYLAEDTGPCDGCARPESPSEEPGPGSGDHPPPPDVP